MNQVRMEIEINRYFKCDLSCRTIAFITRKVINLIIYVYIYISFYKNLAGNFNTRAI